VSKSLPDGSITTHSLLHGAANDSPSRRTDYLMEGVVLSVRYVDDIENKSYQRTQAVGGDAKGGSVECQVLIYQGRRSCWSPIYARILQRKTSHGRSAPDIYEEIPNPSSPAEISRALSASSSSIDLNDLSGDRVLVAAIGGNISNCVVVGWLNHPHTGSEMATKEVGNRLIRRHKGTLTELDKNGDIHVKHARGHSVDITASKVEVRHVGGSSISIQKDGAVELAHNNGSTITISLSGDISVATTKGNVNINAANEVHIDSDANAIHLGADDETQQLVTRKFLEEYYAGHVHATAVGPSGPPDNAVALGGKLLAATPGSGVVGDVVTVEANGA